MQQQVHPNLPLVPKILLDSQINDMTNSRNMDYQMQSMNSPVNARFKEQKFVYLLKQTHKNIHEAKVCRSISYEKFNKWEPIIQQFDESNNKLYVIYKGQVVIVQQKDTNTFKRDPKHSLLQSAGSISNQEDNQFENILKQYGTKINELYEGEGFGEIALLAASQKEAKRNATIIACVPTECLIIQRSDFQKVSEQYNKENQKKQMILQQKMPYFLNITSSSTKQSLFYYFKDDYASRNVCLTEQGKIGEYVYILIDGRCTVEKQYHHINGQCCQENNQLKITELEEFSFFGEEILFLDKQNNNQANQYDEVHEILVRNNTYKYTIRVVSLLCKCFKIHKQNLLNKFPKEIIQEIQQKYIIKENGRNIVFEKMINNLQYQKGLNGVNAVQKELNQINYIDNKDIFQQMKTSMVDQFNKNIIKKNKNAKNMILKEPQILNISNSNDNQNYQEIQYRKQLERKEEEIQQKKVLLYQKYYLKSKQKAQQIFLKGKNINHKQNSLCGQPQEQIKTEIQTSEIQENKFVKNTDGSLDPIQLMDKLKFKKISIKDISFTDIMGQNFDRYNSPEANRLMVVKSEISSQKQLEIDLYKLQYQKQLATKIYQKMRNNDLTKLDLGFLQSLKKKQIFNLISSGKIKVPQSNKASKQTKKIYLNNIKDKIHDQKVKQIKRFESSKSNFMNNNPYLQPILTGDNSILDSAQSQQKLKAKTEVSSSYYFTLNKSQRPLTAQSLQKTSMQLFNFRNEENECVFQFQSRQTVDSCRNMKEKQNYFKKKQHTSQSINTEQHIQQTNRNQEDFNSAQQYYYNCNDSLKEGVKCKQSFVNQALKAKPKSQSMQEFNFNQFLNNKKKERYQIKQNLRNKILFTSNSQQSSRKVQTSNNQFVFNNFLL